MRLMPSLNMLATQSLKNLFFLQRRLLYLEIHISLITANFSIACTLPKILSTWQSLAKRISSATILCFAGNLLSLSGGGGMHLFLSSASLLAASEGGVT
jgi:hypothetical protein